MNKDKVKIPVAQALHKILTNRFFNIMVIFYIILAVFVWSNRLNFFDFLLGCISISSTYMFYQNLIVVLNVITAIALFGLIPIGIVKLAQGTYSLNIREIYQTFIDNKFTNGKGQHPIVLSKHKDKKQIVYEFANMGLDLNEWTKNILKLESWLDGYINDISYSKLTKKKIILRITPTKDYEPSVLSVNNDLLSREPRHTLFVGESGSGKSYGITAAMSQFSRNIPNVSFWLVDGKNDGYEQFEGLPNFYAGEDCVNGINKFFESVFQYKRENKQDKEFREKIHILVIDELSSILQDLSSKNAEELKSKISRIAKLGRSLNTYIWVGVQKAYMELFGGSRENYSCIIGMGNLDPTQKQMLFDRYKDKMIGERKKGQGYIYISGQGLSEFEVEEIKYFDEMCQGIAMTLKR